MEHLVESRVYCCFKCRNILAIQDDIVDKDFVYGSHRAFLFSRAMNVVEGPAMDMLLLSGQHIIADVSCSDCGEKVGWKYIKCYQQEHLHKLGKTVLVKSKIGKLSNPPFH